MSDATATAPAPPELYDHSDGASPIVALRIDGPHDTRGKARAFFASEWTLDFTAVKVRRTAYRRDHERIAEYEADGETEPYDGWPLIECQDDEPGAHPYWTLNEECRP